MAFNELTQHRSKFSEEFKLCLSSWKNQSLAISAGGKDFGDNFGQFGLS